jgi:NAD+ synthase
MNLVRFIANVVSEAKAEGVLLGLSGGIDSSVVATLCVKALGRERVVGIFMPASFTPSEDQSDARSIAEDLHISTFFVPMTPIVEKLLQAVPIKERKRVAVGNVLARMRMIVNYYVANSLNYLVAGTGDRSEILMGYFTKYGDGGADLLPIGHLYKTEVRELAAYFKLPQSLVNKPSSPQLWEGQKATDEIPVDYPMLDQILRGLFDANKGPGDIAKALNIRLDVVEAVQRAFERSQHKRTVLPVPSRTLPDPHVSCLTNGAR